MPLVVEDNIVFNPVHIGPLGTLAEVLYRQARRPDRVGGRLESVVFLGRVSGSFIYDFETKRYYESYTDYTTLFISLHDRNVAYFALGSLCPNL